MKPKSFDPEKILQVIAEVFARGGYEGTSLDDIIRETGLGKQSLYNAFGDKKAMLHKSLEVFGKDDPSFKALADAGLSGRARIENFFRELINMSIDPSNNGCLVTNLVLEKGDRDRDIYKITSKRWALVRDLFEAAVRAGRKDGSIADRGPSKLVAYSLMNMLSGLRVTFKVDRDVATIRKVIDMNLKALL